MKKMTKLPNHEQAVIEPAKIRDYILSPLHPVGRFKATLFKMMGYSPEDWQRFAEDIRKYHFPLDAEPVEKTKYGQKYAITGAINGPSGKIVILKSIWIILNDEEVPRFITIYPEGEKK